MTLRGLYDAAAAEDGCLVLHMPSLYRRYPVWKKSLNLDVEAHLRIGYNSSELQDKVTQTGAILTWITWHLGGCRKKPIWG